MTFWKFTKSLRSCCLDSKVLSANTFAFALTHHLKRQLMKDNKNFMTSILPCLPITISVQPSAYNATIDNVRKSNSQSIRVTDFCHPHAILLSSGHIHNATTVNANGLLLISKVRNCCETSYSDTRMFSSSQSVTGSSPTTSEKKDAPNTNAAEREKTGSAPVGNNSDVKTETAAPNNAPSKKEMLKKAVKEYGATVFVFHIAMSLCSLGFFYILVSSGLDMVELLKKLGVGESILQSKITQGASTFVIAYAVHKVFAPVRITITLTATPLIVRKLRAVGILKKPIQK